MVAVAPTTFVHVPLTSFWSWTCWPLTSASPGVVLNVPVMLNGVFIFAVVGAVMLNCVATDEGAAPGIHDRAKYQLK